MYILKNWTSARSTTLAYLHDSIAYSVTQKSTKRLHNKNKNKNNNNNNNNRLKLLIMLLMKYLVEQQVAVIN